MSVVQSRIAGKVSSTRTKIQKAIVESLETRCLFSSYAIGELTLGGEFSEALALNEAGQVAGSAINADGSSSNAYLFTDVNDNGKIDSNEILDLGTLGGTSSVGSLLNEAGQVAGYSFLENSSGIHAFLFSDRNSNHAVDAGEMLDLGSLGGTSAATLLNNAGQVAGESKNLSGDDRAFLYTDKNNNGVVDLGEMADLGTLGGSTAVPLAINEAGQVAGNSATGSGDTHAFLYSDLNGNKVVEVGEMLDLGTLGGSTSFVTGMNEAGQVIGYSSTAGDTESHGFIFTDANHNGQVDEGEMADLGTFGGDFSESSFINSAGQVAGNATDAEGNSHAFLYTDENGNGQVDDGEVDDLGTLGGFASTVIALNEAGQVAGIYETTDGAQRSFLYTDENNDGIVDAGEVDDLGTLGGSYTLVSAMTEDGDIIGLSSNDDDTALYTFIYSDANNNGVVDDGEMKNLNHLIPGDAGWVLEAPTMINEAGDIVGTGYLDGVLSPFLMTVQDTTTPEEPATIADVEAAVANLVAEGGLEAKQGQVLLGMLARAREKLAAGQTNTATNMLSTADNKVDSLFYSGRLSEEDYDSLVSLLEEVLENLV